MNNYFTDRKFSVFRLEYNKLCRGLEPVRSRGKPHDPLWSREELIKVMKAIVKADQGFVKQADLQKEISLKKN